MLIGNYSVLNKHPGRNIGGGAIGLGMYRGDFNKTSSMKNNFFKSEESTQPSLKSGFPNGYLHPYSWCLPQSAGGLSSYTNINGYNTTVASIAGGLNGVANIDSNGTLNSANLIMIIWLLASLVGTNSSDIELSGTIPAISSVEGFGSLSGEIYSLISLASTISSQGILFADVLSVISAISSLSGSGIIQNSNLISSLLALANISSSGQLAPFIVGRLDGFSNIDGNGNVLFSIKALAHVVGGIISSGNVSNALPIGKGSLSAEVTPFTDLSPQNLASAVWNSIATAYNTSGTMGYKLNNVSGGSGGGSLTQEEHDKLLSIVSNYGEEILENGMTVNEVFRIMLSVLAGKSSHTSNTVSFRNSEDNKNRVVATVIDDGDRTAITLDGT